MPAPQPPAREALPTLLTSRPQLPDGEKGLAKGCGAAADPPLKCGAAAEPPMKLPEAYSMPVRVRNTFIDTSTERSPSLERFYREREVSTCPSAHIGRLRSLFQDADAGAGGDDDAAADPQPPSSKPQEKGPRKPAQDSVAGSGPSIPQACVLSLSQALSPPFRPLQALGWGDLYGSSFADGAPYAMEVPCDSAFSFDGSLWSDVTPAQCVALDVHPVAEKPDDASRCVGYGGGAGTAERSMPLLGADLQDVPAPPDRPAPGSDELPSMGSGGHEEGGCKPCAFYHTIGCTNGLTCQFCHLCDPEERKRRRKAKFEARRAEKLRRSAAAGGSQKGVAK